MHATISPCAWIFTTVATQLTFPRKHPRIFPGKRSSTLTSNRIDRGRYFRHTIGRQTIWTEYYGADGEPWFGFETVRALPGSADKTILVPVFGHSVGHTGIAFCTKVGWIMHAGDAYFHRADRFGELVAWDRFFGNMIDEGLEATQASQECSSTPNRAWKYFEVTSLLNVNA